MGCRECREDKHEYEFELDGGSELLEVLDDALVVQRGGWLFAVAEGVFHEPEGFGEVISNQFGESDQFWIPETGDARCRRTELCVGV
jgi:hypothetical protein